MVNDLCDRVVEWALAPNIVNHVVANNNKTFGKGAKGQVGTIVKLINEDINWIVDHISQHTRVSASFIQRFWLKNIGLWIWIDISLTDFKTKLRFINRVPDWDLTLSIRQTDEPRLCKQWWSRPCFCTPPLLDQSGSTVRQTGVRCMTQSLGRGGRWIAWATVKYFSFRFLSVSAW